MGLVNLSLPKVSDWKIDSNSGTTIMVGTPENRPDPKPRLIDKKSVRFCSEKEFDMPPPTRATAGGAIRESTTVKHDKGTPKAEHKSGQRLRSECVVRV
jgi:hypothetical protein